MNKRAEEILNGEIKTLLTTQNYDVALNSFAKLASLADALDSLGDEVSADRVDAIVKEALDWKEWLTGLMGGIGGAATTNVPGKGTLIDAIRSGNVGSFFNKDTIVRLITNFLTTGGISILSVELIDTLTKHVPILSLFKDSPVIKFVAEGALTYAVAKSNFVEQLVDGLVEKIEQAFGITVAPATPAPSKTPPASITPTPAPAVSQQEKLPVMPTAGPPAAVGAAWRGGNAPAPVQDSGSASFDIASVPGAKA